MSGAAERAGHLIAADDLLTLDVGPVAHGGHCVARAGGRVVFVRHTLPGERVRARVTEVRKSYLRADAVEVLTSSDDRVRPPCPYAGPGRCGGCDFQHVSLPAQRRLKAQVLVEQLVRLGGLSEAEIAGAAGGAAATGAVGAAAASAVGGAGSGEVLIVEGLDGAGLGWRTRVRYAVDGQGRVGFRRHRSHDVLPIDQCAIAAPEIQRAPVADRLWPGRDSIDVVRSGAGETVVAPGKPGRGSSPPAAQRADTGVGTDSGPTRPVVTELAVGRRWHIAPEAFWQIHPAAADTFARCVVEMLRPQPGEQAWDLYAGAGLFAAALAERVGLAGAVLAVESDPRPDPVGNLADLPQTKVAKGRVEQVLRRRSIRGVDLVVLDPPRSGAGVDVVRRIAAAAPRAVAYVACDPAALARDVRTFRELGWALTQLRAFDAFPMTHHMEAVALLQPVARKARPTGGSAPRFR